MTLPISERKTLLQFLFDLFTHPHAQAEFARDPQGVLHAAGFGGVTPADLREVIPPVLEHCPPHLASQWERMERQWGHHEWHPEHHRHHQPSPAPAPDHVCHPGCGCGQSDHEDHHNRWWDHDRHDQWWDHGRQGWDHGRQGWDHGRQWWDEDRKHPWDGHDRDHGRPDPHVCHPGCGCGQRDHDNNHDRWNSHDRDGRPGGHICHPGCGCEQRHHDNPHDQQVAHQGPDHDYEVGKVLQQLHLLATDYGAHPQVNVFTGPVFETAAHPTHHSIVDMHPSLPTHLNVGGFSHPAPVAHPGDSAPAGFGTGHLPNPTSGATPGSVPGTHAGAGLPTLNGSTSPTPGFGTGAPAGTPALTLGSTAQPTPTGHPVPPIGQTPAPGHHHHLQHNPVVTPEPGLVHPPAAPTPGLTNGIAEPAHAPVVPAPVDPHPPVIHPVH